MKYITMPTKISKHCNSYTPLDQI